MDDLTIYDYDPRNLPTDYLAALGLVAAASAHTDGIVEMAIAGCARLDIEMGYALTTHMSNPLRDDALRALAEIVIDNPDDLDTLDDLLDAIKTAQGTRNTYLHNTHCRHPQSGEAHIHKTSARRSVAVDLKTTDPEMIRTDATSIYNAGIALMHFLIAKNLLPAIPAQPRPRGHKSKAARKKRRSSK